jgi:hypothetical protein
MSVFSCVVLSFVGRGLEMGRSPVQEVNSEVTCKLEQAREPNS